MSLDQILSGLIYLLSLFVLLRRVLLGVLLVLALVLVLVLVLVISPNNR